MRALSERRTMMLSRCHYHAVLLFAAMLAWAGTAGCAKQQHAAPVNPEVARESLRTALETWKRGEAPDSLRQASPSITVQDMDWRQGYRLVDYEIVGDGVYDNANLRCPVKLSLRDPQGRPVTRRVTYMVGTDPQITVFREIAM